MELAVLLNDLNDNSGSNNSRLDHSGFAIGNRRFRFGNDFPQKRTISNTDQSVVGEQKKMMDIDLPLFIEPSLAAPGDYDHITTERAKRRKFNDHYVAIRDSSGPTIIRNPVTIMTFGDHHHDTPTLMSFRSRDIVSNEETNASKYNNDSPEFTVPSKPIDDEPRVDPYELQETRDSLLMPPPPPPPMQNSFTVAENSNDLPFPPPPPPMLQERNDLTNVSSLPQPPPPPPPPPPPLLLERDSPMDVPPVLAKSSKKDLEKSPKKDTAPVDASSLFRELTSTNWKALLKPAKQRKSQNVNPSPVENGRETLIKRRRALENDDDEEENAASSHSPLHMVFNSPMLMREVDDFTARTTQETDDEWGDD